MRSLIVAAAVAALLAGCGQKGPAPAAVGRADVCGMITDAQTVFGRTVSSEPDPGLDAIAGGCSWRSADGAVIGDAAVFEATDAETPEALYTRLNTQLDSITDAPLEPVAGLGDAAVRATGTPGDQTQVLVRKGAKVVLARAASADPKRDAATIAGALAEALAAKI